MGRLQNDATRLTVHEPNPRLRRALAAALSFLAVVPFRSLHSQTRRRLMLVVSQPKTTTKSAKCW
jgi:hypothetical protein